MCQFTQFLTYIYIHTHTFFNILFHCDLSQEIGHQFPVLYSRTLLFIHSECNGLYLPTPNCQSIPLVYIIVKQMDKAQVHIIRNMNKTLLLLLLSRFSRVRLCATPQMEGHQATLSLGFSRQEHWSGLPFPSPVHESEK